MILSALINTISAIVDKEIRPFFRWSVSARIGSGCTVQYEISINRRCSLVYYILHSVSSRWFYFSFFLLLLRYRTYLNPPYLTNRFSTQYENTESIITVANKIGIRTKYKNNDIVLQCSPSTCKEYLT